jgi:hypothetical protein
MPKLSLVTLLSTLLLPLPALACEVNEYQSCFLGVCICLTKEEGGLGEAAEQLNLQSLSHEAGALVLEGWILQSFNTSFDSAQPMPAAIKQALTGYIDANILDRVRYQVGVDDILNLAELTIAYGDQVSGLQTQAMTLLDLVVFRNDADALNNPALWAHELTHVKQYREWGTHEFALRYVRDPQAVEAQANAVEAGYAHWRAKQVKPNAPANGQR